jgi:succinate dehydrogenase / fumarate reductase iron-sulfur subunit
MIARNTPDKIRVRIHRQPDRNTAPYTETFEVPYQKSMNVISLLQEVAANPVTADGKETTPPVWDCNCLEEVCGACSMVINGHVMQACTALVDKLLEEAPVIDLKPMKKFPVVRDLFVDRSRMFEALKKVQAWIPADTYGDIGPGPTVSPEEQETMYPLSRCMTCGCCLEVCPQVNDASEFIGPQAIAQAVLFNMNPTGKMTKNERVDALMDKGGVSDCGNAQNCVKVCPKEVPLTWAIGKAGRDTTVRSIKKFFMK